ncbi:hypothetical protein fugu_009011 [Takifugu bimaculatus]|uniref:Ig-like domain-containing protein n=1 Tax=Takifugu bimaculatus TaxID=433685 RepID=A0A4Z2AXD9_9TELE|nr:hypothetical protein fugu_009011 [Takifugu bimaculatus]
MAHGALATLFTFILLNCIEEGRQDAEMFRSEKVEALAGRDVALPCTPEVSSSIHVIMIEWSKSRSENKKLALYSPLFGTELMAPNVTLEVDNTTMATRLHLPRVTEWDSDVYICRLSTFPLGTIRREIELKVTASDVVGTETSFTEATDSVRATTLTSQHPTTRTSQHPTTQTSQHPTTTQTDVSTDATDGPNTSRGFVTASESATSHTNDTQSSVTTAPATGPAPSSSSNHQEMKTHSPVSDASTSHRGSASFSTRGTRDDTSLWTVHPEANPSTSLEESNTLGATTDRPGNTHATTALSTGDRIPNNNEGNFLSGCIWSVPRRCSSAPAVGSTLWLMR